MVWIQFQCCGFAVEQIHHGIKELHPSVSFIYCYWLIMGALVQLGNLEYLVVLSTLINVQN